MAWFMFGCFCGFVGCLLLGRWCHERQRQVDELTETLAEIRGLKESKE